MKNRNSYYSNTFILFSTICVLLKLSTSILFPYASIFLLCFNTIFIIKIVLFCLRNMKNLFKTKCKITLFICLVTLFFSCLPIYKQIELSRFYLLNKGYNKLVSQVVEKVKNKENTLYGEYELTFPQQLITMNNKDILYVKEDSNIMIGITVSKSFFVRRDFVFFSSLRAIDLIDENIKYESIEWLSYPNWAYVKWY